MFTVKQKLPAYDTLQYQRETNTSVQLQQKN